MANLSGKEIGKYRITERIGRGGMAEVYLGVHTHLDRQVAIKVLHGHLLEGGDFLARFKREAKAVANLRHPNIVQVHDFDILDDIIFMVMEYIDGIDLQMRLIELDKKGEHLSIKQIGSIINDIAGALDYAHSKEMLHRDVKPSNILLDKSGKAYLTDFGIARLLSDQKFTATGALIGTPAYMSPEQGMGEELARASDIYSLGVVAFRLITGQLPYDAQTPIAIVQKQIADPIPDITKLIDDVPETAQEVIEKALAKAPESRFLSAEALVTALRGALQALESTEPSIKTAPVESDDEEALHAPTVAMPEFDLEQPTELMEESEPSETIVEPASITESVVGEKEDTRIKPGTGERKPSFFSSTRNKVIIGVGGLVVVAAVILGTQFLGATPPSLEPTQEIEPTEMSAPAEGTDNVDGRDVVFANPEISEGLTIFIENGGDADIEIVDTDGGPAWRTGTGNILPSPNENRTPDFYMLVEVADDVLSIGAPTSEVQIEIDYLDEGIDQFRVEYDALRGGPEGDGTFKPTQWIRKADSGEYRIAIFHLYDVNFANRIQGGDFRINDDADGAETIRSVAVTLLGLAEVAEPSTDALSGEQHYEEAHLLMNQGRWTNAIEALDSAIDAGFDHADAYGLRAYAKLNLDRRIQAMDDFTRAIDLNPDIFEYWRDRGETRYRLGNLEAALEDLNRGLEINPDDPIGYRYRARVLSELGNAVEAIENAIRAARLEPENFENYVFLYEVYRVEESPPSQAEEAMELLDIAIEVDPTGPEYYVLRGDIFWFEWGDEVNAQMAYDLAVKYAHPGWTVAFDRRGLFYRQTGRCELAIEDYSRYIENDNENPFIFLGRGECFDQLGDVDMARADFVQVMIITTGIPEFAELRQAAQEWLEAHPE